MAKRDGNLKRDFRSIRLLAIGLLSAASGGIACGQPEQVFKLIAEDAMAERYFGWSVAICGDVAIVGSPGDGQSGDESGSAYIFDVTTGAQRRKLVGDDASSYDDFGHSVAIRDEIAVVGAPGWEYQGAAYVFEVTTGEQLHKLSVDGLPDYAWFGGSVAVGDGIIAVGALEDNHEGMSVTGSVYLFDASSGQLLRKITADEPGIGDWFGRSVSIDGDTLLVGAFRDDDDGEDSGSAFLFDVHTGEQLLRLKPDDATHYGEFGWAVSLSGDVAIVTAHHRYHGPPYSGSAYLFDVRTGVQLHELAAEGTMERDLFGYSVSMDGDLAVVGAIGDQEAGDDAGLAHLFDVSTGEHLHTLCADDASEDDIFGLSVCISGDTIAVGAPKDEHDGHYDAGSAYVFQYTPPAPCIADITGPDGEPDRTVDVHDLLVVLAYWGVPGSIANISGPDGVPDGIVDVHDLLAVLAEWGPCD